jgi:predicted Ser/Thr protein kinase
MLRKAFARAAAKPDGTSDIDFLEAILREREDLREKIDKGELTAYFPDQGMWSHTVFIGDEVFKGPNTESLVYDFDAEAEILQELEGKGLPVPRVTCIGQQTVFFGMTRLPGVTFKSVMQKMTPQQLLDLADDVADFMISMALALPREAGLFATQGDQREPNILVDPLTKKFCGIIDFGLARNVKKEALKPDWVEDMNFREMLKQALGQRKSKLPDISIKVR